MAGSNIPQFGNWDSEEDVPYTKYFEKARKPRGGKMINPNDPQESVGYGTPTPPPSKPGVQYEDPIGYAAVRPTDKPARKSAGLDQSFDKPLVHPQLHQGKAAREGRNSYDSSHGTPGRSYNSAQGTPGRSYVNSQGTPSRSYDSSHGTPGRSRQKRESPDRGGAAIPKFAEWDEKNPQSAENYSYIFSKVRAERHADSSNVLGTPTRPSNTMNQEDDKFQKRCCPWW